MQVAIMICTNATLFLDWNFTVEAKVYGFFDADTAYAKSTSPRSIVIRFDMVDYLQISPDFVNEITPDFEELGYKNPYDMDIDWLLQEEESFPNDHLVFTFSGGAYLLVHSQYSDITLA
jgi:hypothetical protein